MGVKLLPVACPITAALEKTDSSNMTLMMVWITVKTTGVKTEYNQMCFFDVGLTTAITIAATAR